MIQTRISVNGSVREDAVEDRLLLVQYLRDTLGLTGTHVGCDTSQCGVCTVLLDGQAVRSCTVFVAQANGGEVMTVEGLGQPGSLHPLQEGFWSEHGLQCGFCTPGMLMTAAELLARNPDPTEAEIRQGLEGVICRCTGYQNIVKSVQHAARELAGASSRPAQAAAGGSPVPAAAR